MEIPTFDEFLEYLDLENLGLWIPIPPQKAQQDSAAPLFIQNGTDFLGTEFRMDFIRKSKAFLDERKNLFGELLFRGARVGVAVGSIPRDHDPKHGRMPKLKFLLSSSTKAPKGQEDGPRRGVYVGSTALHLGLIHLPSPDSRNPLYLRGFELGLRSPNLSLNFEIYNRFPHNFGPRSVGVGGRGGSEIGEWPITASTVFRLGKSGNLVALRLSTEELEPSATLAWASFPTGTRYQGEEINPERKLPLRKEKFDRMMAEPFFRFELPSSEDLTRLLSRPMITYGLHMQGENVSTFLMTNTRYETMFGDGNFGLKWNIVQQGSQKSSLTLIGRQCITPRFALYGSGKMALGEEGKPQLQQARFGLHVLAGPGAAGIFSTWNGRKPSFGFSFSTADDL